MLKVCSAAALVFLVFLALGPATWQPRSGLGWEIDHFVGYFVFALICPSPWPRPLVVGGALWLSRFCWRTCNLFYRIARPIL